MFNVVKITKDFYVIDGQHRLSAAKELNLKIYYTFSDLSEECIPTIQNQKSWTLEDFSKFHAHTKDEYKTINEICIKFNLSHNFVIQVCFSGSHGIEKFRSGDLKFDETKEYLIEKFTFLSEIRDEIKKIESLKMLVNALHAIWMLILDKEYDHKHFIDKINKFPSEVRKAIRWQARTEVYNELVNKVYNRY